MVAVNEIAEGVATGLVELSCPSPPAGLLTILHAPVVARPPILDPESVMVPPEQISVEAPASATAPGLTIISMSLDKPTHPSPLVGRMAYLTRIGAAEPLNNLSVI